MIREVLARAISKRASARYRWLSAAAAAALLAVALAFMFDRNLHSNARFATSIGEVRELQLPDGSRMILDADSVARATFTVHARKLRLEKGRVLLVVRPDSSRPISVSAAGRDIVAVDTQLDVNIVPDGLTVTLLGGRADISSLHDGRALVTLSPGQQYIERDDSVFIRSIGAAVQNVIAWPQGLINFDDQPLDEAAAIMNRYSRDQLMIGANAASIRVSGQFRAGDTQRFAATLAEMHGLSSTRQANRIGLAR